MGIFKSKTNILFLFIIFLLVAALSGVSYFAYEKHTAYTALSSSIVDNSSQLEATQQKIDELTSQLANADSINSKNEQEKAALNSQLQEALREKERLEQENSSLKTEIEQLKTQKRRDELQNAIKLPTIKQADTANSGVCYLTFDDGPSENTVKILDILDRYNVKATFFVVGTARRDYMPQIVNRGHAIGLHSTTHKYDVIYKDINSYLEDIKGISDIVYNATGVRSNIIRFPGGSSNLVSAQYTKGIMTDLTTRLPSLGYAYFDWNVTSGDADAARVPAATIISNVLNIAQHQKSICVLMHDNGAKDTTVEALPGIIEGLSAMGFRFEPLTAECFGFHQKLNN